MIKNLDKTIKNLKKVRNSIENKIFSLFIKKSLIWIRDRAINILESKLSFSPNWFGTNVTNVSSWSIRQISAKSFVLENNYENSAAIEFGIGVKGQENPHELAQENGYEYNQYSESKDLNGTFTFTDQNDQVWYRFSGYVGKSFLYDSLMEYKQNDIWKQIYQQAFDEIMRGVIK